MAPFLHLCRAIANSLALLILTFSTGLTLDGCTTARSWFDRNTGHGGASKGPAIYFFTIHVAILSVTTRPLLIVFFEFSTWHCPSGLLWWAGAPNFKYSIILPALFTCDSVRWSLTLHTFSSKAETSICVSATVGRGLAGNFPQNSELRKF